MNLRRNSQCTAHCAPEYSPWPHIGLEMCLLPVTVEETTSATPITATDADDAAAEMLENEEILGEAADGDADGDGDDDESCRILTGDVAVAPALTERAMNRQGLSYLYIAC
jgi:hypothetical protein